MVEEFRREISDALIDLAPRNTLVHDPLAPENHLTCNPRTICGRGHGSMVADLLAPSLGDKEKKVLGGERRRVEEVDAPKKIGSYCIFWFLHLLTTCPLLSLYFSTAQPSFILFYGPAQLPDYTAHSVLELR